MAPWFSKNHCVIYFYKMHSFRKIKMISEKPLYLNEERHVPQNTKWSNSALAGKSLMISLIIKRCKAMITWNLFQPDARINLWQVSFLQLQKHFQARPCSFSSYAQSVIHVWIFLCSDRLNSFLLKLVFWHFKILFLKIIQEKILSLTCHPFAIT